jgi:hypothetical protein
MGGDLKHWKRNKIENPGTLPITRGPSPLAAMRWTSSQTTARMALTSTTSPTRSFLPSRAAAAAAGGDDLRRRFLAAPLAIAERGCGDWWVAGGVGFSACRMVSAAELGGWTSSPGIRGGAQEKAMEAAEDYRGGEREEERRFRAVGGGGVCYAR